MTDGKCGGQAQGRRRDGYSPGTHADDSREIPAQFDRSAPCWVQVCFTYRASQLAFDSKRSVLASSCCAKLTKPAISRLCGFYLM